MGLVQPRQMALMIACSRSLPPPPDGYGLLCGAAAVGLALAVCLLISSYAERCYRSLCLMNKVRATCAQISIS